MNKEDIVNLRSLVGGKIINIYGTEYDSDGWEWQCYLESDGT